MEIQEQSKLPTLKVLSAKSFIVSKKKLPPISTLIAECHEMLQVSLLPTDNLKREKVKQAYEVAQELGDQQRVLEIEDYVKKNSFKLVRPDFITFARNGFFINKNLETKAEENIERYIPPDPDNKLIDKACIRFETMQLGICYGCSAIIIGGCIMLSVLFEGLRLWNPIGNR